MKKENRYILSLSKEILSKENYSKLKEISDEEEKMHAAKYLIIRHLEKSHALLKKEIDKIKNEKEMFFARNNCDLLGPKIKLLNHDFSLDMLKKAIELRHNTWREMTNGAV